MSALRRSLDGDKAVEMDVIEAKADADTSPAAPTPPAAAHEPRPPRTPHTPSPRPLGILPRLLADARPATAPASDSTAPSQTALSLHPSRGSLAPRPASADRDAPHDARPPPASFHTLPPELHLAIARALDFPTALRWRLACRYFAALLPADALPRKRRAYVVSLHRQAGLLARAPPPAEEGRAARGRRLLRRTTGGAASGARRDRTGTGPDAAMAHVRLPCHQCLRLKSVADFESHTWGLDPGLPPPPPAVPFAPPAAPVAPAVTTVDPWLAAAGLLVDGGGGSGASSASNLSSPFHSHHPSGSSPFDDDDDDEAAAVEEARVPYRVCVACKLRKRLFARGARFDWRGRDRVLCRGCGRAGRRATRRGVRGARMRELCRGCAVRAEWGWQAPVAAGEALLAALAAALVAWGARAADEGADGGPFRCIVFTVSWRAMPPGEGWAVWGMGLT